jgi:hypothetical protein
MKAAGAKPASKGSGSQAASSSKSGKSHKSNDLSQSIISDNSSTFERNAAKILRAILWSMFRLAAFPSSNGECEQYMNRVLKHGGTEQEVDFCSTLEVRQGLTFLEDPAHLQKIKILNGTLEEWLENLLNRIPSSSEDQANLSLSGDVAPSASSITPTKTSAVATHYVVCESKIRQSGKSIEDRLEQLERVLKILCLRKGASVENAPSKALEMIALAGIGVPASAHFNSQDVRNKITQNQQVYPILNALYEERRVFVLEVDTLGTRMETLEAQTASLKAALEAQAAQQEATMKAALEAQAVQQEATMKAALEAALEAQAAQQEATMKAALEAALEAQAAQQEATMKAALEAQTQRLAELFKART